MVKYETGRQDADCVLLMKTVTYYNKIHTKHPMYGTYTISADGTGYSVKAQVRPATLGDKLVKQGKILQGDVIGVLRYEYSEDVNGTTISPTITPAEDDELIYNNRRFRVANLTPIYDEDGILMWFDCSLQTMDDTGA